MRTCLAAFLTALLFACLLPGCSPRPTPECGAAAQSPAGAWVKTELYFGLSKPEGGAVGPAEWKDFLDKEITPRFSEGLTVLEAEGQWTGSAGQLTREKSKVVILVHEDTASRRRALQEICEKYKQLFHQDSVLRVATPAGVNF